MSLFTPEPSREVQSFVEDLRKELCPDHGHSPAHISILPPRCLLGTEAEALEVLESVCRSVEPFEVVMGEVQTFMPITPTVFVRVAQAAFAVAHDEHAPHPFAVGARLHLAQVGRVLRPVHEELIHVLDGLDVEAAGGLREVEVVELAAEEGRVERPFGQRDLEQRLGRAGRPCGGGQGTARQGRAAEAGCEQRRSL